jgi:hypothetical protein
MNLGKITAGNNGWAQVDELDRPLSFDGRSGRTDIVRDDINTRRCAHAIYLL